MSSTPVRAVCPTCGPLTGFTNRSAATRQREGHYRSRGEGHFASVEERQHNCTSLVCNPLPRPEA